jgi:hypothetical protein
MTFFALNAGNETNAAVAIRRRRLTHNIGRVALQAAGNDRAVEIGESIPVTGTVHPAQIPPLRHRQLKKQIVVPVQIRLAFTARSNHNAKLFRAFACMWRRSRHRCLKKFVLPIRLALFHPEKQIGICSFEDVVSQRKAAQYGLLIRHPGRQVMRSLMEGIDLVRMA